jgi:uncharacterized protein YchJ
LAITRLIASSRGLSIRELNTELAFANATRDWHMKPGRNDPCPCGSGKKYKRCCLSAAAPDAAPEAAPADLTWRRLRTLLEHHAVEMLDFIVETYGPLAIVEAWAAYIDDEDYDPDPDPDIVFTQLFIPWFFNCWAPNPFETVVEKKSLHGVIPTRAYLTAKGRRLDPLLQRYLESVLTAPFTFFEVVDCNPGTGMTLRDVMTQEEHAVTERSASRKMQPGDLLFGQLASVDHLTMLEASNGFAISPAEKAAVIVLRTALASVNPAITHQVLRDWDFMLLKVFHAIADRAFNPPLPILQNTDGDPISPHKLVFDLKALPQAAFDALKHLALDDTDEDMLEDATRDSEGRLKSVLITWKKYGNKMHTTWDNTVLGKIEIDGARLVAEVNSAARADAVRNEIETALGEKVHYRASEIQSAEKILADLRAAREVAGRRGGRGEGNGRDDAAAAERKRLAELPEVREKVAEMLEAHWEHWVEKPIPILGNRTPLDAVKDRDGREIVESLVIQGERHARSGNLPPHEHIFHRVRERLGLAASHSEPVRSSATG